MRVLCHLKAWGHNAVQCSSAKWNLELLNLVCCVFFTRGQWSQLVPVIKTEGTWLQ